jgi:hypothetical protein
MNPWALSGKQRRATGGDEATGAAWTEQLAHAEAGHSAAPWWALGCFQPHAILYLVVGCTVAVGWTRQTGFLIFHIFSNKQICSDLGNTKSILILLKKFQTFARWKINSKETTFLSGRS